MNSILIPVDLITIRLNTIRSFNVYFESLEGQKVLYCASGEEVTEETLKKIREHDVKNLFIEKKDKGYYDSYVEEILGVILDDPQLKHQEKSLVAYTTVMNTAKSVFTTPKAEIIQRYKKTINDTVKFVLKNDGVIQNLIGFTTYDFTTYNHCLNVGIFSVGLFKEVFQHESHHDVGEIAAGFFLHDIGKITVPVDVLNKKGTLSPVEWMLIKRHPEEGLKILDKFKMVSPEIEAIVMQHHERHNGQGYPNGLRGAQINVYSRICSIADVYDGLTSSRPYKKAQKTFNALKIMKKELFKDFDPAYFTQFIMMFSKIS